MSLAGGPPVRRPLDHEAARRGARRNAARADGEHVDDGVAPRGAVDAAFGFWAVGLRCSLLAAAAPSSPCCASRAGSAPRPTSATASRGASGSASTSSAASASPPARSRSRAIVHLFNLRRFEPIVRPTVLTAFLGYVFVIVALMFDLGQPWRIWHALVFWNPHSVMFEVALVRDALHDRAGARVRPSSSSASGSRRPQRVIRIVYTPLVIVGRDPLDAAPVVARLALPDRPVEAAPALVHAAAAVPLLHLRDRGGPRHGDPRVAT